MPALFGLFDRFNKAMREIILPFWAAEGFVRNIAQFGERTDFNGEIIRDVPLRAMVQARQIYVYSDAERTGEMRGGGERALEALETLLTRYSEDRDLTRGLAFSVSLHGNIVSSVRDSYTHAFVLFALASAFQLTQETNLLRAVDALIAFIDNRLTDDHASGLLDRYPNPGILKLQNPMMHMLEAFLALHEAWPDRGFLDRAAVIVRLFRERLFQPDAGVVFEKYLADWTTMQSVPSSFFEPGHQFEWTWLLNRYDTLAGTRNDEFCERLWVTACEKGLAPGFLCLDEVAVDPMLSKRTSRVWPHTEGIKAAISRRERGDLDAERVLTGQLGILDSVFLGRPFSAGWVDRVAADGQPISDMVPASTLYHLYSAFKETSRSATLGNRLRDRVQAMPL
jgi:mannose/cellobiose epimerase-like protein (N-acyl-D-glucosamine 2-epimerase family)